MSGTISVLLLTRSSAGQQLLDAVVRRRDHMNIDCHTLTFNPEASEEIIYPHIAKRIEKINKGAGVLVLIDSDVTHQSLFQKISTECNAFCIVGLNDAMIEAATACADKTLEEAAQHVALAAKQSIHVL